MTKRNALMEWLDQTKKLAKSKDYMCLDLVDRIFEVLPYIRPNVLKKHKKFFDDICTRYHKDNPLDFIGSDEEKGKDLDIQRLLVKKLTVQNRYRQITNCVGELDWKSCEVSKQWANALSRFVDSSLALSEAGQKDILWQWFEIVDFMFERPELINPELIDDYITERITTICREHRKNNPLSNGLRKRFGKFWRDSNGRWRRERRRRI